MTSVLLVKPGSMGDVVHALPVASAIRRAWPDAVLTWVVDPRWAPLLEGNPAVSAVRIFPREKFRGVGGWVRAALWYGGLVRMRPDVVVDLQGLLRSALIARCSRGRVICGLGDAREGAGHFYSRTTKIHPAEHAVRRYLQVLPLLGIEIPAECEFPLPPGIPPEFPEGFVVLHPFARGAGKSMGAREILAFLTEFRAQDARPVVVVGVGEVPEGLPEGVINLSGKTSLAGLLGILRGACFVVSVDSGPMHLAAALGVPVLAIHTWSDPRLVGPYREDAWIWQGGEVRRQDLAHAPLPEKAFSVESALETARFVASQIWVFSRNFRNST